MGTVAAARHWAHRPHPGPPGLRLCSGLRNDLNGNVDPSATPRVAVGESGRGTVISGKLFSSANWKLYRRRRRPASPSTSRIRYGAEGRGRTGDSAGIALHGRTMAG